MSVELIGILAFVITLVLIFIGMPIGFTLAGVAFVGMMVVVGPKAAMGFFASVPFSPRQTI
ncbi:MAG: hypothetical protein PVI90_09695 [Desulfobacteraceae bacterium]